MLSVRGRAAHLRDGESEAQFTEVGSFQGEPG